jgi:hypothetical protein
MCLVPFTLLAGAGQQARKKQKISDRKREESSTISSG